ncbi:MAG: hypothetical protein QM726_14745 [Chitinophagaceae bacterium]
MFSFFKKNRPAKCPVDNETRQWLEASINLLFDIFKRDRLHEKKVMIPHHSDFPIRYDGTELSALESLKIVCRQMDIPYDEIKIDFFTDGVSELDTGSPLNGGRIFLSSEGDKNTAGLYFGRDTDGLFHIALERKKLNLPENMVATLAHELSHVKLLGENRIDENDEKLTDLTTILFGMGIFNANSAFQTYTTIDSHGWRKMGYLTQMEWGYALALVEYKKKQKDQAWLKYLSPNVRQDFLMGLKYLEENKTDTDEEMGKVVNFK